MTRNQSQKSQAMLETFNNNDNPELLKAWYHEHRFDKEKDKDLITLLRQRARIDNVVGKESIPELPPGLRLLPITKILSWECKLDIL